MELKECPFCGGKADVLCGTGRMTAGYRWIACMECGAESESFKTVWATAKRWNARAERTCRNVGRPERDGEDFVCSECGCTWSLIAGTPADNGMSYCPGCGARIERNE